MEACLKYHLVVILVGPFASRMGPLLPSKNEKQQTRFCGSTTKICNEQGDALDTGSATSNKLYFCVRRTTQNHYLVLLEVDWDRLLPPKNKKQQEQICKGTTQS